MVEKIVFTKSKFDNLAIEKEFGIVLWIIGILRVLAEIEFKFPTYNIETKWMNNIRISSNLESNTLKSYDVKF
jgi:hypothetical protein